MGNEKQDYHQKFGSKHQNMFQAGLCSIAKGLWWFIYILRPMLWFPHSILDQTDIVNIFDKYEMIDGKTWEVKLPLPWFVASKYFYGIFQGHDLGS